MIRGYPRTPSVFPGETLTLHVSTDSPSFRVEFHRQGATLVPMTLDDLPRTGHHLPDGPPDRDWGWPAYHFDLPASWPPGVYVAMLVEIGADGTETAPDRDSTFARSAKALFVVRHRGPVPPGTPLYKLAWATYVAYNATGYGSLYSEAVWSRDEPRPGFKVTWRRPGCGTGGEVMDASPADVYSPDSDRQTFEHWDAPFVRWLEDGGYAPHYCTDWDLHREPDLAEGYDLLLSAGHDEYWSPGVRERFRRQLERGGNIAFFTGNTCFWRVHFTDDDTAITCAKVAPGTRETARWERDSWAEQEPEAALTCVSYELGGGWWDRARQVLGYTVQHAGHWVFAGTGLKEGGVFGDDDTHPLVGYEVDGASFIRRHGIALPTGELGTPRDFTILGIAELGEGWFVGRRDAAATMGIRTAPSGGIVFQAATTDWPILVGLNPVVATITRNVIDRLRWPAIRVVGPLPARGGRMIAACGQRVSFHADLGAQALAPGHAVRWNVVGGRIVAQSQLAIEVEADRQVGFLTVSASLGTEAATVGFGTTTSVLLDAEDAARFELMQLLRELAAPDEPAGPMVALTHELTDQAALYSSVHEPMLGERAERLRDVLARLAELTGWSKPDPGPR